MANEYFVSSGAPGTRSKGDSAPIRAQFSNVETAFEKMPVLAGFGKRFVRVNTAGTGLTSDTLLQDDGVKLTATGEITSTKTGQFLSRLNGGTNAQYMFIQNTSGNAMFGLEGSTAGGLIVGSAAYDAVVKGKTGITMSADDGATAHFRIRATGHVGFFGTNPTGFGNGWYSTQYPNGCATMVHNSIAEWNIMTNLYYTGAAWKLKSTGRGLNMKLNSVGGNPRFQLLLSESSTADATVTPVSIFSIDNDNNMICPQTYSNTTATAANVLIDSTGEFFRSTSSLRYKDVLRSMNLDEARQIVMNATPFLYASKCEKDDPRDTHWGLGAEDFVMLDSRFVMWGRNADGSRTPDGLQYERLSLPLIVMAQDFERRIAAIEARIQKNVRNHKKVI